MHLGGRGKATASHYRKNLTLSLSGSVCVTERMGVLLCMCEIVLVSNEYTKVQHGSGESAQPKIGSTKTTCPILLFDSLWLAICKAMFRSKAQF